MTMSKNRSAASEINVLYVLGSGRSGSTLLDLLLGSHPQVFGMGEVVNLPAFLKLNWECHCGAKLDECVFWQAVLDRLEEGQRKWLEAVDSLTPGKSKLKKLKQLLHLQEGGIISDALSLAVNDGILRNVLEMTKSKWLVDSSKGFERLIHLSSNGSLKLKVIHLVRDGRGYVYSRRKRPVLRTLFRIDRRPVPVWKASLEWVRTNLCCLIAAKRLPKEDRILVRYEDLARHPVTTLIKICQFIGVPYDAGMIAFRSRIGHNVGGNRMRFDKATEIRVDDSWKTGLSARDTAIFLLIGGPLNLLLSRSASKLFSSR